MFKPVSVPKYEFRSNDWCLIRLLRGHAPYCPSEAAIESEKLLGSRTQLLLEKKSKKKAISTH